MNTILYYLDKLDDMVGDYIGFRWIMDLIMFLNKI